MKKLILRAVSVMMLVFGITFVSALSPLQNTGSPLLQSAYADEEDEDSSAGSETTEETSSEASSSTSTGNNDSATSSSDDNPCQAQSESVA